MHFLSHTVYSMNPQLSDYVIVGKHLCKKIIIIKNEDIQYMNYSIAIENAKYFRNSLLISLGFILRDGIETEPYEPILRKLSLAFLSLEVRNSALLRMIAHPKSLSRAMHLSFFFSFNPYRMRASSSSWNQRNLKFKMCYSDYTKT